MEEEEEEGEEGGQEGGVEGGVQGGVVGGVVGGVLEVNSVDSMVHWSDVKIKGKYPLSFHKPPSDLILSKNVVWFDLYR